MDSYYLENIEQTAKENFESFFIPSLKERKEQKRGDTVRLHFIIREKGSELPRAERMWVEIIENRNEGLKYSGILTNQPKFIKNLDMGDTITFEPKNIAMTIIKKSDPRWVDCSEKKALVSAKCIGKNGTIRFLYREKPDNDEDSGWRLFTGEEDDEYSNDSKNIRMIEIGWLVDFDPSLLEVIKIGKNGDAFERAQKNSKWEKVLDWRPAE